MLLQVFSYLGKQNILSSHDTAAQNKDFRVKSIAKITHPKGECIAKSVQLFDTDSVSLFYT